MSTEVAIHVAKLSDALRYAEYHNQESVMDWPRYNDPDTSWDLKDNDVFKQTNGTGEWIGCNE